MPYVVFSIGNFIPQYPGCLFATFTLFLRTHVFIGDSDGEEILTSNVAVATPQLIRARLGRPRLHLNALTASSSLGTRRFVTEFTPYINTSQWRPEGYGGLGLPFPFLRCDR